jgi:hypothetical protein
MINLTELLDRAKKKALEKPDNTDGYAPKSTDELRFKKKHVVQKTDDRNGNKDDVFNATNVKTLERAKERHGYDVNDDEKVYEGYQEISPFDSENNSKSSGSNRDSRSRSERIRDEMNKLGKQHGRKNLASDIEKKYSAKNEEVEVVDEATYSAKAARAGKDIGKPGKSFAKIAAKAATKYGSEERGKKVAGAILAKIRAKHMGEETQEQSSADKKADRLAAIAAAAKKKNAQIGKTIVTGSKGGVGGAETRRYPAGTLKNSHEPEGEELDEARRKKSPTEKLFNRLKNYGVKDPSAKPLVGNQTKLDKNNNGKLDAEDFKILRKEEVQVDEVLKPSMGAGAYIADFVHSKNPKFAGKSKKERMKQALAAYYAAKRGE